VARTRSLPRHKICLARRSRFFRSHLAARSRQNTCLFVEPNIFHAPAIEEAVGHLREPSDVWLPAGRALGIEQDRSGAIFSQLALDLPEYLLALRWVTLA
jgi:hypothetical protein